jgi:hypothetical protein
VGPTSRRSISTRLPLPLVIALTVAAVTAIGMLMERGVIRPVRHADVLNLIIVTIGASILIKGGVMVSLGKNAAGLPAFTGERPIPCSAPRPCPRPSDRRWACAIVVIPTSSSTGRSSVGHARGGERPGSVAHGHRRERSSCCPAPSAPGGADRRSTQPRHICHS